MINQDIIKKRIAGIFIDNKLEGSGCILSSINQNNIYCITARHCIKKDKDIKIKVKNSNNEWIEQEICNYIESEEDDIAIFKLNLKYKLEENVFIAKLNDFYNECFISGYPKQHNEEICFFRGTLNSISNENNKILINLNDAEGSTYTIREQINGISGGGCFVNDNEQYKIFGIETNVITKEGFFREIQCIEISKVNKILIDKGWDGLHEPILFHETNYICSGYKFMDQISQEEIYKIPWIETKASLDIMDFIKHHMLYDNSDNILLICGLSGIGKTRTVIQACNTDKRLKKAAYFNSYKNFSNQMNIIINYVNKTKETFYIVIDDVTFDEWQMSCSMYAQYKNIRIIMISTLLRKQIREDLNMIELLCANKEEVKSIIGNVDPLLNSDEREIIYELCKNDLRFAILIANEYKRCKGEIKNITEMYSKFSNPSNILERICKQYSFGEDFKKCIYMMSLFIDIGFKNNSKYELEFLSKYFDESIRKLKKTIEECSKINLGIVRENYFELSPRALARLIFEMYGYELICDINDFYEHIPSDVMKKRFMDRVNECDSSIRDEVMEELNEWFQDKYGELTLGKFNRSIAKDAKRFIEFSPIKGLNWILNIIENSTNKEILNFKGYFGRREIVWACEHLANFKEYFCICEKILFKLALNECEKGITNNSQGVWSDYFNVCANTEVPFFDRFNILLKRVKDYKSNQDINLFKKAFEEVFSDSCIRVVPPKIIGGRITPKPWKVQNLDEIISIKRFSLEELCKNYDSFDDKIKEVLLNVVINSLSVYTDYPLNKFYKECLNKMLNTQEIKNNMILKIETQLKMISYKQNNEINNYRVVWLNQWKDELTDNTLEGRIRSYITRDYWSYGGYKEKSMEIDEDKLVSNLAQEIIDYEESFELMDEVLLSKDLNNSSVKRFASKLAQKDKKDMWLEYVEIQLENNKNIQFSMGYIIGVYQKIGYLPQKFETILDKYQNEYPHDILTISINTDISNRGYKRILNLLKLGYCNQNVVFLKKEEWGNLLELNEIKDLIGYILNINKEINILIVINIFTDWLKLKKFQEDNFIKFIFEILYTYDELYKSRYIFEVIELLKNLPKEYINKSIELVANLLDFSGVADSNMYQLQYLSSLINDNYDKKIMNEVGKKLLKDTEASLIKGCSIQPFFDKLPSDIVMEWIKKDSEKRAKNIAYHLREPSLEKYYISELTKMVLEEFEENEEVYNMFWLGIHNWECYSVEDVINKKQKSIELLNKYENESSKLIKRWANDEKNRIYEIEKNYKINLVEYNRHIE